jgi:hypothetical protein
MVKKNQKLTDSELIEAFVACAIEREQNIIGGTVREATRSAYRMKSLDEIFRERGRAVQLMLLPYLDDPNEGVRYWASMRLWPIAPAKARATMEGIPNYGFGIGAEASGTLNRIDSGQFDPSVLWASRSEDR